MLNKIRKKARAKNTAVSRTVNDPSMISAASDNGKNFLLFFFFIMLLAAVIDTFHTNALHKSDKIQGLAKHTTSIE